MMIASNQIVNNEEPFQNDWDKSQAQLIAELNTLRAEVSLLKDQATLSKPYPPRSLTQGTKPYILLIVDDSETDRAVYHRYLRKNPYFEYEIVDFETGTEALQWCETHIPDLLLIDYFLPDMNGLEFLGQLRQKAGYEKMPGIIMTGQQNQKIVEQSLKEEEGLANDLLDKNRITSEGLHRSINNVLQHAAWMQEQDLQWQRQQLINNLAFAIRENFDLATVFQTTVAEVRHFLECDRVLIYQFNPQTWNGTVIEEAVLEPQFSILGRQLEDTCFLDNPDWINLYRQGRICCITDILAEPHYSDCYQHLLASLQVRGIFVAPISLGDKLWGLFIVHHCQGPRAWAVKEVELLHQVSNQLSLAVQKTSLQQQAEESGREFQKIEGMINTIATALVSKIGDDFFQLLVNYLCQILEVDYVLLSELETADKARTLAVCYQEQIIPNFEVDLRDRPCGQTVKAARNSVTIYPDRVSELFPKDRFIQENQIQSYLGIPLFNAAQEPIGNLAVFHSQSLSNIQLAEEIFKIFAGRAGAELERRQIEARLRQSEQELLEAQRIAHVGHWKWDKATDQVWWSEELYRIFGLSPHTPMTLDLVIHHIHPDDRQGVLTEMEKSQLTHHFYNLHRICRVDGTIRFLQTTGAVTFGQDGQIDGLKGISLDVTELKQAELELQNLNTVLEERVKERTAELTRLYLRLQEELNERKQIQIEKEKAERSYYQYLAQELNKRHQIEKALQEREAQLRAIGDNLPKGSLYQVVKELDGTFRFLYFSAGIEKETGYQVREIYQDYNLIYNTILEEDRPLLRQVYQESATNLSIFEVSVRMRSPQGKIRWIRLSASPRRLEDGRTLWDGVRLDITELKQAQLAIQESEEKFRQIAETIQDVFYLYEGKFEKLLYVSPAYERLWQKSIQSVMENPRSFLDSIHPDDRAKIMEGMDNFFQGQGGFQNEYRLILPDGSTRWIYDRCFLIVNEAGEPYRIAGLASDITAAKRWEAERLQTEEDLRQSRMLLETLASRIPGTLYSLVQYGDQSIGFDYLSSGSRELLEYEAEQIIQNPTLYLEAIHPDDRAQRQEQMVHSLVGNEFFAEWRMITPSGKTKWVQANSRLERRFDKNIWHGVLLDISDRKKSEEALRASEERYRRIVETANEGIWMIDAAGKTVFVNQKMAEMLGVSPEFMLNKTLFDFMDEAGKHDAMDFLERRQNGVEENHDFRFKRHDGTDLWTIIASSPIFDAQGNYQGALGLFTNITERKQSEQLLQFQAQILAEIHDAVISTDGDGIIQTWNHGAEGLFGYTAAEAIGRNIAFLYFPEDLDQSWSKVFDPLQTYDRHQIELRNRKKSGEEIYIRLRLSAIHDHQGKIINIIGCSNDITEQKRYQTALIESKQFLETVLDSFPLFVFWKDRNLNYLGCNRNFATICGFSSVTEIYGKTDEELLWSKEEADANQADDRKVITTGEAHLGVIDKRVQKDGSVIWLETNKIPLRNVKGEVIGVLETYRDVTSRKQTEAAIQEFNRRWRSVLDSIQMIVVEIDTQGIVEYINPFFQKLSQYSPKEVIGKHWITNFVPPHLSADIENLFHHHLQENSYEYHVNPILTKTGEERMIAWRNSVLRNSFGEPIGMIAIGEDITDRYHLERMKAQFLSIVSHELRTPLTAIQAALSLLHEKVLDPNSAEGEITLGIATDGIDRLVRLVNDILDLERLRSGKIRLEKRLCDAQKIIKNAIAQVQDMTQQTGIQIQVLSQSINLYADEDRLIQVLINLLSNAIKFSPNNSEILVAVDKILPPVGEPSVIDWVKFSVSDRGRGIPPQNLESIFEPFQQVDASDAREKGGTGLGLAICRDIVEQHGGKIWVNSDLGKGSIFAFTIPTEPFEALNS